MTAYNRVDRAINRGLEIYAQESLVQFESRLASIENLMKEVYLGVTRANAEYWQRSVICSALTFAASLHIHQERSMAQAKRLHGAESDEWLRLKRLFNREYDSYAGYRLTYRLRNVMIHHSVECVGLHLSAQEERSSGGIVLADRYSATARLVREQCVATDKKYLSAAIRKELVAMDDDPDLLPLFRDALASIHRISRDGFGILNPDLDADLARLCDLDLLFGDRIEGRALARMVLLDATPPRRLSMPHTVLNPEIFLYAKEVYGLKQTS
ncbi:hypothetical protein OG589_33855 [Sphaerisporangium sp. NBC_01403]|uniref:hypothetical protein n=1 Tax=Sphaerisporangium sp. NBC_01403 TaxID=2903599 RepID=UPI0032473AB3